MAFKFKIQTPWLKGAGKPQPEQSFYSGREHLRNRAFQYVCARYGIMETAYRFGSCDWRRQGVTFDETKIGNEMRIRAVTIDDETYAVPHWDFVPTVEDVAGVFA